MRISRRLRTMHFSRFSLALGAALVFILVSSMGYAFASNVIRQGAGWYTCRTDEHADASNYMIVRNNGGQPMCIGARNFGDDFTVEHSSVTRAWADFPNIFLGCETDGSGPQLCSTDHDTPMKVSAISKDSASVSYAIPKGTVANNAFDIWFNKTGAKPAGHDNAAELMIWTGARGLGMTYTKKVEIDGIWWGYDSWNTDPKAYASWHYIRFWRLSNNASGSLSINLIPFFNYAEHVGRLSSSWYLTGTEYGFETCKGGRGETISKFVDNLVGPGPALGALKPEPTS